MTRYTKNRGLRQTVTSCAKPHPCKTTRTRNMTMDNDEFNEQDDHELNAVTVSFQ